MDGTQLRQKLAGYLAADPGFRTIYDYTKKRFTQAKNLIGHNWEHAYRDTINAIVIGEAEGADMTIVLPAMVMHDIGFLYGAESAAHGDVGADKLEQYLQEGGIALAVDKQSHIAACIRTHKGNIHGKVPETLEAKVVSDADVLDKFGPIGAFQMTRTWAEFGFGWEQTVKMIGRQDRRFQTKTAEALAAPRCEFNQQFAAALRTAYEPYMENPQ